MAELKPYRFGYYLWNYVPNIIAAILFAWIFALLTITLLWKMCKTKTWYFTAFVIGGLFEVIGFAARASAHSKTDQLMPFVIQNTFILLAPALFAASIYMILGRVIIACNGQAHSLVPMRWLTKTFVLGDVLSFTVQGGAAGLMATGDNAALGEKIVVAGLFIQIIIFGFFMVTTVVFHFRMSRHATVESQDPEVAWRQRLAILYAVSILIMVRSVFRVAEFVQGQEGYLLQNEWPIYVFDALLMALVMAAFVLRYPGTFGRHTPKSDSVLLRSWK
nr:RTA1 like protein [Colletotrichum truncatum]KAF6796792.1 RTA1 like protein [Colletotrichum truncatum]